MKPLSEKIIGTWVLVSWTYKANDEEIIHFLGERPHGVLYYSRNGLMSVQIMKHGRSKFESGELMNGTQEEINEAFKSYFAYFGSFEEKNPGELIHHIEGGNFPNWTGTSEIRNGILDGNKLVLSAPSILPDGQEVLFEVEWKRADND